MNTALRALVCAIALFLLPLCASAQVQNEGLANGIINARKQVAALLQQYNWNSRTEIIKDGKVEDLRIDLVSLGADGQPQRTLLNDQQGQLPGGFLRKAIEEKKRKELEEYVSALSKLVEQYTLPSAGKVIDFIAKAQVQPVTTPDGKTILNLNGSNVVNPGDTFGMTVDGRTLHPINVQITTTFKGSAVTITANFKDMKTGPNHVQFATVSVPDKGITVNIHNYDYVSND